MANPSLKYRAIRALILSGDITEFTAIFELVSTTRFSRDTGISVQRLKALKASPFEMLIGEGMVIAQVIGVELQHVGLLAKNAQWAAMN
jgi:hypothetical protein